MELINFMEVEIVTVMVYHHLKNYQTDYLQLISIQTARNNVIKHVKNIEKFNKKLNYHYEKSKKTYKRSIKNY